MDWGGASSYVLAPLFAGGGLLVWPAFRRISPNNSRRLKRLRVVFWCHLVGLAITLAIAENAAYREVRDAYAYGFYVYLVGIVSVLASAIILLSTRGSGRD